MIDERLPQAITYRRREFENEAMMRELCLRAGLTLPVTHQNAVSGSFKERKTAAAVPLSVFVICHKDNGFKVLRTLEAEFQRRAEGGWLTRSIALTTQRGQLATADRVLLLLTAGVLEEPSCGQLVEVLEKDGGDHRDRIVALFSDTAGECSVCKNKGWGFGCKEHQGVPQKVKDCLNEHEATQWREKEEGPSRHGHAATGGHEFAAMVDHLVEKLAPQTGAQVITRGRSFSRQSSKALR